MIVQASKGRGSRGRRNDTWADSPSLPRPSRGGAAGAVRVVGEAGVSRRGGAAGALRPLGGGGARELRPTEDVVTSAMQAAPPPY